MKHQTITIPLKFPHPDTPVGMNFGPYYLPEEHAPEGYVVAKGHKNFLRFPDTIVFVDDKTGEDTGFLALHQDRCWVWAYLPNGSIGVARLTQVGKDGYTSFEGPGRYFPSKEEGKETLDYFMDVGGFE